MDWQTHMDSDVNAQNQGSDSALAELEQTYTSGKVTRLDEGDSRGTVSLVSSNTTAKSSLPSVDPSELNPDQFCAYNIITWHLDQTLAGLKPLPLRMIIHGKGGMGKSRVIQTVTDYFAHKSSKYLLLKAAYTSVTASLIDGKTTHVIGMISTTGRLMSDETKAKLQQFWRFPIYLIINEISMISKAFLAVLSRHISMGKGAGVVDGIGSESFGGISVIFCGDFHQFPPVACGPNKALYEPSNMGRDSVDSQLGHAIYEEFKVVVILRKQWCVTDPTWQDFLTHLRYGQVQEHHLTMLRHQIVKHPHCLPTDFSTPPWNDAALVTPQHAVCTLWNDSAVRKHCSESHQQLFICLAEDRINGRKLTLPEHYGVATRKAAINMESGLKKRRRWKNDLPDTIQIAIGMKVMVTENVETGLDITNGARGEIVDIILDPNKPPIGNDPIVTLKCLPAYILVKMARTRATQLEGLDENVIPVQVATHNFQIKVRQVGGKYIKRSVRQHQFPMTLAYTFMDYRSQGQTIPFVMVDIATLPTGGLSLFNLYVALSRSSGRSTIRLLRDFDNTTFMQSHSASLLQEDDRLDKLDALTKSWWRKMGQDVRGNHVQVT